MLDDESGLRNDDPGVLAVQRPERRLAAAITVLVAIAIPFFLPDRFSAGPVWLIPIVEGGFLVAIIIANPDRSVPRSRQIRGLSIGLVVVLVLGAAAGTARLVWDLLHDEFATSSAGELLQAGALVWIDTIIAFTFLFWELDGGGPAGRFLRSSPYPDFAFVEQVNPELAPPGWRPVFVDYLYLAITNSMAFSPTDVMPLARWAKLTMALQSVISLVILSLVIANAVNILG